jgi:hypothetical protein
MRAQPGRERVRGAVGQHVHALARLHVQNDRSVHVALLEGEIVDTQDAGRGADRFVGERK